MASYGIVLAIESNPDILGGKPVVKGTRIPVALLLELVEAGLSIDDILREYPHLRKEECIRLLQKAQVIRLTKEGPSVSRAE